jgi:hypothetical protein
MANGSSYFPKRRFEREAFVTAPSLALPLVLSLIAGCAAPPPARTVDEVIPPTTSPASPAEPAAGPASADPPSSVASADRVVTLIAKPGLWPLDVESARRVLQALGPVTREQPTPNELSLVGGPFGALQRFDVDYSLDDDRYWVFGSAGFVLEDRDLGRLYRAIQARLTQLLGRPASSEDDEDEALPTVTWSLGEAVLSLAPSREGGEPRVLIAIHETPDP